MPNPKTMIVDYTFAPSMIDGRGQSYWGVGDGYKFLRHYDHLWAELDMDCRPPESVAFTMHRDETYVWLVIPNEVYRGYRLRDGVPEIFRAFSIATG